MNITIWSVNPKTYLEINIPKQQFPFVTIFVSLQTLLVINYYLHYDFFLYYKTLQYIQILIFLLVLLYDKFHDGLIQFLMYGKNFLQLHYHDNFLSFSYATHKAYGSESKNAKQFAFFNDSHILWMIPYLFNKSLCS